MVLGHGSWMEGFGRRKESYPPRMELHPRVPALGEGSLLTHRGRAVAS